MCIRDRFVAGVFPNVSSVEEAKNILKPQEVLDSEIRNHVKRKSRLSRRNAGFVRQGEWFFVPVSDFHPDEWLILHKEPIQRGQGKPHIVEYLYRYGGTTVYVSQEHPTGLTESSYRHLVQKYPEKKNIQWRIMKRDPKAYAKGRVRHPDHKTIILRDWHLIVLNLEVATGNHVAFLD